MLKLFKTVARQCSTLSKTHAPEEKTFAMSPTKLPLLFNALNKAHEAERKSEVEAKQSAASDETHYNNHPHP